MNELTWRPVGDDDLEAVVAVVDATTAADGTEERMSVDELVERLDGPWAVRATDSRVGVTAAGEVVAWGLVESRGEPVDLDRIWVWGGVHPAHRGRGHGRHLLAWQIGRADELHRASHPDVAGVAEATAPGGAESQERLFRRMGMEVLRWWFDLGQSLADIPSVPVVAPEVRIVPYGDVEDEAVRLAFNAAWADHWGSHGRDREGWTTEVVGSSVFRGDLSAVAGGEVVALLLAERYPQDDEVRGHAEAWVGTLGTVREWRGRSLASALVVNALHAFRADGLDHAMIGVDADSLTGAAALYCGLGFVEEHRFASWAHPLE